MSACVVMEGGTVGCLVSLEPKVCFWNRYLLRSTAEDGIRAYIEMMQEEGMLPVPVV